MKYNQGILNAVITLISSMWVIVSACATSPRMVEPASHGGGPREVLHMREVVEMIARGEEFAFLHMYASCGLTPDALVRVKQFNDHTRLVYYVEQGDEDELDSLPSDVISTYFQPFGRWSPVLFYYRGGQLVDVSLNTINDDGISGFVERNQSDRLHVAPVVMTGSNRRKRVLLHSDLSYLNLSGLNVSGVVIRGKSFEGSDLRNASFVGASLIQVNFSHANLRGADFGDVREFSHVFWGACICPDGTSSVEHQYSCDGHLVPDPDPDVKTEPFTPLSQDEMFYDIDDNDELRMF